MGVGGVTFSGKKRYEGVRFNVISARRGWVGVQFPGKKHYVTLEWPLTASWLIMAGVVCVLVMIEGFEVSTRSRMLPDLTRFGSFNMFCN